MKTMLSNGLKRVYSALVLILISLLFLTPVEAKEVLTNMNQLPQKEAKSASASIQTVRSESKDIVILYKEAKENNVGNLNLDKDDFSSGATLNNQVDVLEVSNAGRTEEVIDEIENNDNVLAVSEDSYLNVLSNPNDQYFSYQSYLSQVGYGNAWNRSGGNEVKIAVMDTGVLTSHEDLVNRSLESGKDYTGEGLADLQGHGTAVASVAAAQVNNGIGIAGSAGTANVKVVNYKVGYKDGSAKISSIAQAITDIINEGTGIKVINISLGAHESPEVELKALQLAEDHGIVVVSASGNSNENVVMYPAKYPTVIATGAVNSSNQRCTPADWGEGNGSNYGDGLNIMAPGTEIAGADNESTNGYRLGSGTSYSCPMVAGACALILSHNPNLTPAQVRDIIYSTAQDLGPSGVDAEYGYGVLRIDRAIDRLNDTPARDKIALDQTSLSLKVGETAKLNATSAFGSGLNYSSSNSSVASVDNTGLVTAVAKGDCTITVTSASDPSVSANCSVKVTDSTQPAPSPSKGYQHVYRLYNSVTGEHLFTTDTNEVDSLSRLPDWNNEGAKWEAPEGGTPVYRLYSLGTHNHLYTTDTNEVSTLTATGSWTVDNGSNPLFYSGGNTDVYRLYNETLKMHLLTTDANEYNALPQHGWTQEGAKLRCK